MFFASADINVTFNDAHIRKRLAAPRSKGSTSSSEATVLYLFTSGDSISGQVLVSATSGSPVKYTEIRCDLIGRLTVEGDSKDIVDFLSMSKLLDSAGTVSEVKAFDYCFGSVDLPYESYSGITATVRYFLRVTMKRPYAFSVVEEQEFWVQNVTDESEVNTGIKMEVGIEDCLHLEFEYNKSKYHLTDVIIGKIYFLLVKIKVRRMELSVIRRETTGCGLNWYNDSETVAKFEIMDGPPVKGESIPVRLFLGALPLTPTYLHVCDKFSTRNFLNLVLIDEDDRRYYKQQEIHLWRRHL
eukprot:RCo034771